MPLAVQSMSRLGMEAARFVNDLGDVAAVDGDVSKATLVTIARQELSCSLFQSTAGMYDRSLILVVCVV